MDRSLKTKESLRKWILNELLSQVCPGPYPTTKATQLQQETYPSFISCSPQMKPEKKAVELSEEEKVIMNLLKDNSPIDLNELKGQTGLSNLD